MFNFIKNLFKKKTAPPSLTGHQWTGSGFVDSYKQTRTPTPNELIQELRGIAWTCASINSQVCASYPPSLYSTDTSNLLAGQSTLSPKRQEQLRKKMARHANIKTARSIQAVGAHPLLDLVNKVNPYMNSFDLWELTTMYQESHGCAFWYLDFNGEDTPQEIWILPSQNIKPKRHPGSTNIVDYYEYKSGRLSQIFQPWEIICFRYPDPKDPYLGGLSPLRVIYEQAQLINQYTAFKDAKISNRAIPDAIVSPDEVIGEEERDRLESQWNAKFRRSGAGRVVVAESAMKVQLLTQSLGDIALLADATMTKEDIANAFHVPLSFLSTDTNLANLQAAQNQHMQLAIGPRLERRDEKLNSELVPLFDPTRSIFFASDDPTPIDPSVGVQTTQMELKYGIITINEYRNSLGLEPVSWGDQPWMPLQWAQTDYPPRSEAPIPAIGRGKQPKQ